MAASVLCGQGVVFGCQRYYACLEFILQYGELLPLNHTVVHIQHIFIFSFHISGNVSWWATFKPWSQPRPKQLRAISRSFMTMTFSFHAHFSLFHIRQTFTDRHVLQVLGSDVTTQQGSSMYNKPSTSVPSKVSKKIKIAGTWHFLLALILFC